MPENRRNGILKLQLERGLNLRMLATAGGAGYTSALSNMKSFYGKLSLEEQEKTIKARAEVDLKKTDDPLADIFFARSEEIQKEIINQMKTERKPGFINKLYSRHGATLTSAATTPLARNRWNGGWSSSRSIYFGFGPRHSKIQTRFTCLSRRYRECSWTNINQTTFFVG